MNATWPAQNTTDYERIQAVMNEEIFPRESAAEVNNLCRATRDKKTHETRQLNETAKVKSLCNDADTRVACMSKHSGYVHWRARAIIKEINAITSPLAFVEYETELRQWIASQESRLRTKILRCASEEEYMQYEHDVLCEEEAQKRHGIEYEMITQITFPMEQMALYLREAHARQAICAAAKINRHVHITNSFKRHVILANVIHEKRNVHDMEVLCWNEMRRRRLTEVGQELQLELIKVKFDKAINKLNKFAHNSVRATHALCALESRDRHAITSLSLLHLSVLYNECNNTLPLVISNALQSIWTERYSLQQRALAHHTQVQQNLEQLVDREERLRVMVESNEATEMTILSNDFILGWRNVYMEITSQRDESDVIILAHLELFERRQITDLQRHELYQIGECYHTLHRLLVEHERAWMALVNGYEDGLKVLMNAEHAEFVALHRQYHFFVAETRAIASQRVLLYEEKSERCHVMRDMLVEFYLIRQVALQERCLIQAMTGANHIAESEHVERSSIIQAHWCKVVLEPMQKIINEEMQGRSVLLHNANDAVLDIVDHFRYLYCYGAICTDIESVIAKETETRSSLMCQEKCEMARWELCKFVEYEQAARERFSRGELLMRCLVEWKQLMEMETVARNVCVTENEPADRLTLNLCEMNEQEEIERMALTQKETQTRARLLAQCVTFDRRLLEACQRDEYSTRLDLMLETQLEFHVCTKRFGQVLYCAEQHTKETTQNMYDDQLYLDKKEHYLYSKDTFDADNKEMYKDTEKEMQQCVVNINRACNQNMKFDKKSCLSVELEEYAYALQQSLEPMARTRLYHQEENECALFQLIADEDYNRIVITLFEKEQWMLCMGVSTRIMARQMEFETWQQKEHGVGVESYICSNNDLQQFYVEFLANDNVTKITNTTIVDNDTNGSIKEVNKENSNVINTADHVECAELLHLPSISSIQESLRSLFIKFYWTRDALVFDESVTRATVYEEMNTLLLSSCKSHDTSRTWQWRVHSIFLPVREYSDSLSKLQLRMWWANDASTQYESNFNVSVTSSSVANVVGEEMRVVQLTSATALHRGESCNIHHINNSNDDISSKNKEAHECDELTMQHLCLMLVDEDMNLIASATLLLPSNSNNDNNSDKVINNKICTLCAPLYNSHGRIRLMYCIEPNNVNESA